MKKYDFEINMSEEFKDLSCCDEWGCAYFWSHKLGAEYNYCIDGDDDYSAIYLMYIEDDLCSTDHNCYVPYHIDWNDEQWEWNLQVEMISFVRVEKHRMGEE